MGTPEAAMEARAPGRQDGIGQTGSANKKSPAGVALDQGKFHINPKCLANSKIDPSAFLVDHVTSDGNL